MSIGDYDLTVPLDSSNSITLFAFVSGMLPYQKTFKINPNTCSLEGCGQGIPLKISNLNFPNVVKAGGEYSGSVDYEGSFEDIANPIMISAFPISGGTLYSWKQTPPRAASDCHIDFVAYIHSQLSVIKTIIFFIVDWDDSKDTDYNLSNNIVSNTIVKSLP